MVLDYKLNELLEGGEITSIKEEKCPKTGALYYISKTKLGVTYRSEHVILATGMQQWVIPSWAPSNWRETRKMFHTLEPMPHHSLQFRPSETVMVVGGGLTSAQFVVKLCKLHPTVQVYYISEWK
jgi:lysine/ornithine N-monooxygenase